MTADDSAADPPGGDPAAAAREHLLAAHTATIDAVLAAADAVAADWPQLDDGRPATADREVLVDPLRTELDERGVPADLTELLAVAVDAAGCTLPARPVPAPPYVVITSTGPVLRGTDEAGRLVVAIDCFEAVREPPELATAVGYVRSAESAAAALSVSFESSRESP